VLKIAAFPELDGISAAASQAMLPVAFPCWSGLLQIQFSIGFLSRVPVKTTILLKLDGSILKQRVITEFTPET
jgi:hypothetical protein